MSDDTFNHAICIAIGVGLVLYAIRIWLRR